MLSQTPAKLRLFFLVTLLGVAAIWFSKPDLLLTSKEPKAPQTALKFSWETHNTQIWNLTQNQSQQLIQAQKVSFQNHNQTSLFKQPLFMQHNHTQVIEFSSVTANSSANQLIEFSGDVLLLVTELQSAADKNDTIATLNSQRLIYNAKQKLLTAEDWVSIETPSARIQAKGLRADIAEQELKLQSQVNSQFAWQP